MSDKRQGRRPSVSLDTLVADPRFGGAAAVLSPFDGESIVDWADRYDVRLADKGVSTYGKTGLHGLSAACAAGLTVHSGPSISLEPPEWGGYKIEARSDGITISARGFRIGQGADTATVLPTDPVGSLSEAVRAYTDRITPKSATGASAPVDIDPTDL